MDKDELIHFTTRFTTMPDLQMKLNQDNLEDIEDLIQEIYKSGYEAGTQEIRIQVAQKIIKEYETERKQVKEAFELMKDFGFYA